MTTKDPHNDVISRQYRVTCPRSGFEDEVWTLRTGSTDDPEPEDVEAYVQALVDDTRIAHSYSGPLTAYVWHRPVSELLHYREPVPEDALRFEFPAVPSGD